MEINPNNENKFAILNVALRIPKKLKSIIELILRIADRELDDLFLLHIIDQLDYFKEYYEGILDYMKFFDTFNKYLSDGIDQYYNQNLK